jgi:glycosyltransferase involved in cell wall biosynthesis
MSGPVAPSLERARSVPRVTVGLPVYNGERFLRESLESLLAQDYEDFELIISDNGSTDGTEAICREFAARDARIRYLRESENHGGAWNFNRLPALARGEYFRWACHDDTCERTHLRTCVEALDCAAPSVVLVFTGTAFIDERGVPMRRTEERLDTRGLPPHVRYRQVARTVRYSNALFGLFRLAPLLQTRLHAPYANSDYVLFGELALLGEFWELPGHLFRRRLHSEMSRKVNRTQEAVATWFDTSKRGRRFYFPELSLIRDQFGAVRRARIGALEKLQALWVIPRVWIRRRRSYIAKELLAAFVPRLRRYS